MAGKTRRDDAPGASEEYNKMLELERLESLREELEELGIKTVEELDQRIHRLHLELDEGEGV